MLEKDYFKVTKLENNIYRIHEPKDIYTTVILGSEKALVIDNGHGFGNVRKVIESITDLPLMVVNTHGHLDHAGGNYLFDEVYINFEDIPTYYKYEEEKDLMLVSYDKLFKEKGIQMFPDDFDRESFMKTTTKKFLPLENHQIIDLGGRKLEVIKVPGHTVGHVTFLDYETGILFSGDAVSTTLWLYYDNGITLDMYCGYLEDLKKYPIKGFLPTHIDKILPIEILDILQEVIRERDPKKSRIFTHARNGQQALLYRKEVEGIGKIYLLYPISEKI